MLLVRFLGSVRSVDVSENGAGDSLASSGELVEAELRVSAPRPRAFEWRATSSKQGKQAR